MIILKDENSKNRVDILGMTMDDLRILKTGVQTLMNSDMEFNRSRVRKLLSDLNDGMFDYRSNEDKLPLTVDKTPRKPVFEKECETVDLGLPSGLLWATCNVGATSPEQAGLYFAWGETTGYTAEQIAQGERIFLENTYKAKKITTDLTPEQDAAHTYMGGKWRMPTEGEYQEMIDNCISTWTTDYNGTGVSGMLFTSIVNGNSVFFPASGYCYYSSVRHVGSNGRHWSASWYSSSDAWKLYFYSGGVNVSYDNRGYGFSVRGVCE